MTAVTGNNIFALNFPVPKFIDAGVSVDANSLKRIRDGFCEQLAKTVTFSKSSMLPSETRQELIEINTEHKENGWDGYDALPIDNETLEKAYIFLLALPRSIPLPEVEADPSGEISFEWYKSPTQIFNMRIDKLNMLTYAGLFGADSVHGRKYFRGELSEDILAYIKKI